MKLWVLKMLGNAYPTGFLWGVYSSEVRAEMEKAKAQAASPKSEFIIVPTYLDDNVEA